MFQQLEQHEEGQQRRYRQEAAQDSRSIRGSGLTAQAFSRTIGSALAVSVVAAAAGYRISMMRSPSRRLSLALGGRFIDLGGLGSGGSRFEVRLELGAGVILSIARG